MTGKVPHKPELLKDCNDGSNVTEKIIDAVIDSISDWKNEFKHFGVPADEINRLAPEIEKRLGL
jgi:hypothetical protein